MKKIIMHFSAISSNDSIYVNKVETDNAKQKNLDKKLFTTNESIEFSNIMKPEHIPEPIRGELLGTKYNKSINLHACNQYLRPLTMFDLIPSIDVPLFFAKTFISLSASIVLIAFSNQPSRI